MAVIALLPDLNETSPHLSPRAVSAAGLVVNRALKLTSSLTYATHDEQRSCEDTPLHPGRSVRSPVNTDGIFRRTRREVRTSLLGVGEVQAQTIEERYGACS